MKQNRTKNIDDMPMKSVILKGEAPFTERIYEYFCMDCKYKKLVKDMYTHPCFVSANGVCVRFKWASDKLKEQHKAEVLENQAFTIWTEKGKKLEEIRAMPRDKLLSVLTKKHFAQFAKREQEDSKALASVLERAARLEEEDNNVSVKRGRGRKKDPTSNTKEKEDNLPENVKGKVHYFYCEDRTGKKSTIKRSVDTPSYRVGVRTLRKSLIKDGIKIIKEEIK